MKTAWVFLVLASAAAISAANAQMAKWPEKPVRIIVAAPPGSGDDVAARLISPKLGEIIGQQVVVENRPGAAGLIGQTFVLNSPPDGYTLLFAGGSMAGARYVNTSAKYDVLRDFTPVSHLLTTQFVMLVHPTVPARDLRQYIALARSQPGKMTYGVSGPGQIPYWSAVLFNTMAQVKAVEISYKSGGPAALVDVMAGRLDYYFPAAPVAVAHKGRLRALAVTGVTRSPVFPEVPTVAEAALPGYEMTGWASLMGPARMRRAIVDSLNVAVGHTLAAPDIRDRMQGLGAEPMASTPEALTRKYADWVERFGKIAKQAGIIPQ